MIKDLGKYNNDVGDLQRIDFSRYENIFQVAQDGDFYFYNIAKTVIVPDDLDPRAFVEQVVDSVSPWTAISYRYYGTQNLWWLICIINKITNPVAVVTPGTKLKILKTDYVDRVLRAIRNQIES